MIECVIMKNGKYIGLYVCSLRAFAFNYSLWAARKEKLVTRMNIIIMDYRWHHWQ